jgi:kinesin family protein 1
VFNDIGKEILEHTYQGYNSTIFAYGQTGSGKSYSIEGYPPEKGLLQLCCEDIFNLRKPLNTNNGTTTTVQVSYLEIYNEKLRDLLNPSDEQLKIMSSGTTVFIQGLSSQLCESYAEVEKLFYDGKKIRVIGAHAMNKNSSRSHAVFTIYYK